MNEQERYARVQQVFLDACVLADDDRRAFLDRVCAPEDRAEVERLLKHDVAPLKLIDSAESGEAIHQLASGIFGSDGAPPDQAPLPERIGRYRIIRLLGHGGMGVVYEAEQDEPKRRVAVKVLHPAVSSPAIVRRFRHEAQALAHLHHPGIAHVFDVGADAAGQPFFAMELIDGLPLLDYAETHNLNVAAKLQIIAEICDAVHHAHQRGIIHRDLKPGNIIVEAREPSSGPGSVSKHTRPQFAQPRILDFGIARIADEDLRSVTQQTTMGEVMGTIPYMSPEQTTGDPSVIDTRSDVYALGVIMFELLSGNLPIDVRHRSMHEAIRAVQHDEPARVRTHDRTIAEDVETIAAKALEKDKARRYQSAAELATDIRRYLSDQPILARPPSAMYQLRKFARRNRALAAGGAIAATSLLLASIVSTVLAVQAVRAEHRQRDARRDAELARDEAEATSDFLANMLGAADPERMGKDVRIVDVLALATDQIGPRFPDNPAVRAHLHRNIGITYRQLGMLTEAEQQLTAAVGDARLAYSRDHPALLRALNSLAVLYDEQGRFDDSVPIYEQILAIQERTLGRSHRDTLGTACNLGLTLFDLKRLDEARAVLEATRIDMLRALGPTDRYTINCIQGLGSVHLHQGRFAEAADAFQQVLDASTEAFGPNDMRVIRALSSLSEVREAQGHAEQALQYVDDAIARAGISLPPDHWLTGRLSSLRGTYLKQLKRFEESEAALLAAHRVFLAAFGPNGDLTQHATQSLVELYQAWNKPTSEAEWKSRQRTTSESQPSN